MKALLILVALTLAGCASPGDYAAYANGQAQIESAKHAADAARYKAMSDIAASGDSTAKVAAVMALAIGQGGAAQSVVRIQAPKSDAETALQWASILVPGVVNATGIVYGAKVATNASNNAAAVSMSTNSAFVGMAGKIQAPGLPQANVYTMTTTNTTTNTDRHDKTLSGTGTLGSGDYSTVDRHDVTDIRNTTTTAPVAP